MKKPILISIIAAGGVALVAGAIYAIKKSKEYFGDCCFCCEGCCEDCDNPCFEGEAQEKSEDDE